MMKSTLKCILFGFIAWIGYVFSLATIYHGNFLKRIFGIQMIRFHFFPHCCVIYRSLIKLYCTGWNFDTFSTNWQWQSNNILIKKVIAHFMNLVRKVKALFYCDIAYLITTQVFFIYTGFVSYFSHNFCSCHEKNME